MPLSYLYGGVCCHNVMKQGHFVRLRQERELRGWSRTHVAEQVEVDIATVGRWERGDCLPHPYHRQKLCELFDKDAQELGLLSESVEKHSNGATSADLQSQILSENEEMDTSSSLADKQPHLASKIPAAEDGISGSTSLTLMGKQNRQRMLKKMQSFWINGVLKQSLHGLELIIPDLKEQPNAVTDPWVLTLQPLETAPRPLPSGMHISQVYDDANSELLILGEPGSGKTTLLLELARTLLERAIQKESHPIPVVFNLASWAIKREPLNNWLVEELHCKYQVPRKLAQSWVQMEQIIPLLDGLDEVTAAARCACIGTINAYRLEHGLQPMVVCARLIDYLDQGVYLLLRRAVVVQPLNTQRVEEYLIHAGEKYAPLRAALQIDPALQELAVSPLMLSTLALTYQDHVFNPPSEPLSLETRGKAVFANYVEHMLVRRKGTGHYTAKQTLCWLSWLARMLVQHQQTEFYIESMQPSWLSTPRAIRWYGCLLVGLLIGLLGGTMGMLADLPLYETIHKYLFETLTHSTISNWQCSESLPAFNTIQASIASVGSLPLVGLFYGIAFALLAGLISGLFSSSEIPLLPTRIFTWAGGIARYGFALLLGVAGGSAFILINLFWVPCPFSAGLYDQVAEELVYGLCGALMGGLVGGGLRDLISLRRYHIQPVEALVWTHLPIRRLLISVIMGGMIGLLIGAATELLGEVYLRFAHWQHALPFGVLMGGLLGAAAGAWIGGFSSHMLEKHSLVRPNEGIRRSARNGLLIAIPTGLTFSIFTFTLVLCFNTSNITDAILWSLPLGLFMIEILFLLNGGYAVLQHQVLRFLLYYQHSIPWNYARFLDEATEALLLRKVGGGYMFIHRLLLEYFASYEAETQKEQHMSKARLISRRRLVVKK